MIHGSTKHHIAKITRGISRILRVTMGHSESEISIHILSTYAPQNGHKEDVRRQHLGEVKEALNGTCKRHLVIWRADSNGKIGRIGEKEDGGKSTNGHAITKIIGPYARTAKTENGTECNYRGYAIADR